MRAQAEDDAGVAAKETPSVQQINPVPRISIQAFCETQEVAAIVQAAISDRRMNKAHVKLHMGGAPAAVEAYRSAPTPNLIVLEATHDRNALVGHLDELSQFCDAGTKVIICGKVNDIVLYRQLMLRGVSEYLVAPFGVMEFVHAVSNLYTAPGANPVGPVFAPTIYQLYGPSGQPVGNPTDVCPNVGNGAAAPPPPPPPPTPPPAPPAPTI